MYLGGFLLALIAAVLFSVLFIHGFKRPGPWPAWWTFFLIIFLVTWAASLWVAPVGPVFIGIYWFPIILVAFIVAVFLAAASPPQTRAPKVETISQAEKESQAVEKTMDIFFWILIASLIIAIVLGYVAAT